VSEIENLRETLNDMARQLEAAQAATQDYIAAIRGFVKDLRPTYLEELGLIPALETISQEANSSFELVGQEQRLPSRRSGL
jgi:signal transduction histidine kinase